jgi:hypothetical protein
MKADTFVKLLRKVVREEVQAVVREELGLLLETPTVSKPMVAESNKPSVKNSMVESIRPAKPTQSSKPMSFSNNDVLNQILNETANSGEWRTVADMKADNAAGFSGNSYGNEPMVVESVNQMFANTRPAGSVESVRIDVVPDFTGIMAKMKQEGQI